MVRSQSSRAVSAAVAVVLSLALAGPAAAAPSPLERSVLDAVQSVRFDRVLDFDAIPAKTVANTPNVDVAVLRIGADGKVADAADVLLSRDHPSGAIVPIDPDLGTTSVQYRAWDIDRWDGITPWDALFPPATSLGPLRPGAPLEFMSPYPASLFKLPVAFGVLRALDGTGGALTLDTPFSYQSTASGLCSEGPPRLITRAIRAWLDPMISESNNLATCAMLAFLHQQPGDGVDIMNQTFQNLGLSTIAVLGTTANGDSWNPGEISMSSLDTARLLALIDGSTAAPYWSTPAWGDVTREVLTAGSRSFLGAILADQGFNEVLSTTNYCGAPYPAPGIPAGVSDRWVQLDGTVVVDGIPYADDVRPCNAAASVTFAHKTGLTYNYGADAGIVRSLPGTPDAHYIIAVTSNLGYRYGDRRWASLGTDPCSSDKAGYVCYTEKFSQLGARLHTAITGVVTAGRSQGPIKRPIPRPRFSVR